MEKLIQLTLKSKLEELTLTRYELSKRTGIKFQTIDNYYKNKVKKYDSYILLKICIALDCDINDILKIITPK